MSHTFSLRVYYEDTDMGGMVYHANYLKFIERARSEWVESLGIDQDALRQKQGVVFAVKRLESDFLSPARYGDKLTVETVPVFATGARLELEQLIYRGEEMLFTAEVLLVAVGAQGNATRLPAALGQVLPIGEN